MGKIEVFCYKAKLNEEQTQMVTREGLEYRQKVIGILAFMEGLGTEQVGSLLDSGVDWFEMYCQEAAMARGISDLTVPVGVDREKVFSTIEYIVKRQPA